MRALLLSLSLIGLAQAQSLPDWAKDPMICVPSQLLKAPTTAADPQPTVLDLVQSIRVEVDAQRHVSVSDLRIMRVLEEGDQHIEADGFAGSQWYKARARVVDSKGRNSMHEAKLIGGVPILEIPGVKKGAIIVLEYQHGTLGKELLPLGRALPLKPHRWIEVSLSHPVASEPRIAYGWLVEDKQQKQGELTVHHYHATNLNVAKILADADANNPEAYRSRPFLQFSYATSWAELATAYRQGVEPLLQGVKLPVAEKAAIVRKDPKRTAVNLVNWLHKQISYSEDEILRIVPYPPAKVLARGSGNGADLALLLVGMLRQAKIEAVLVLLDHKNQADPELPCAAVFGRVLVYLPESKSWIDPSRNRQRLGLLPSEAQERPVLPITPTTVALSTTPASAASETGTTTRTVFDLSHYYDVAVSTVFTFSGVIEDDARQFAPTMEDTDEMKQSDPDDVSKPFSMQQSWNMMPSLYNAGLRISLESGEFLPILNNPFMDLWFGDTPQRAVPFQQLYAQQIRCSYEFLLPPGYELSTPIAVGQYNLGTVKFSLQLERKPGRVVIDALLDSGKRTLSPDELKQTWERFEEHKKAWIKELAFDSVVTKTGVNGERPFQLLDKMAQNPETWAWAVIQKAGMLLLLGLDDQAAALLESAMRQQPDDQDLLNAFIAYTQDRPINALFPRSAYIAALEKRMKLEPGAEYFTWKLADVLERNPQGERFGSGVDLQPAYKLREKLDKAQVSFGPQMEREYQELLLAMGEFYELAARVEDSPQGDDLLIAGRWLTDRIDETTGMDHGDRVQAMMRILAAGHFRAAAKIINRLGTEPKWATLATKVKAVLKESELLARPNQGKPLELARDWVALVMDQPRRSLDELIAKSALAADRAAFERLAREPWLQRQPEQLKPLGRARTVMTLAEEVMMVQGNAETGYRIGLPEVTGTRAMYLAEEEGALRVVAFDLTPHLLGRQILALLEAGKEQVAQTWLDWAAMPVKRAGLDPLATLWGKDLVRDKAAAMLAARSMIALGPEAASVRPALARAYGQATGERRLHLARLMLGQEVLNEADGAMVEELTKAAPTSAQVRELYWRWALVNRHYAELERAAASWAGKVVTPGLRRATWLRGGYAAEQALLPRQEGTAAEDVDCYRSLVWHGLLETAPTPELARYAERLKDKLESATKADGQQPGWLTLAAYFADRGLLEDAMYAFGRARSLRDWHADELSTIVTGMLAELAGTAEHARAAYQAANAKADAAPDAVKVLAERRLLRLPMH